MHELRLQFLQPRFRLLAFGQITDEAGEESSAARFHLADRELDGKRGAILALANHDTPDADDALLPGLQISIEILIVIFTIRRRHQDLDVPPENLLRAISEQSFRRRAEGLNPRR